MKRLYGLTALFAVFAGSSLEAQTILEATIPFAFHVGSTAMPAGEYRINYSQHVMIIKSKEGSHTVVALVLPRDRSTEKKAGILEFRRYGSARYFSAIWAPNSSSGEGLRPDSREREVASLAVKPQSTVIALSGR